MSIKNINKYGSMAKFIDACQTDDGIKQLLNNGLIKEITKETILKYDIRANPDGFFYSSNVFDLRTKLTKDFQRNFGKNLIIEEPELDKTNIVKFLQYLDPQAPEIKRFLLATLSKKFQEETKCLRKKYGIQENGFDNSEDCGKWILEKKELAQEELKNIDRIDYIIKNRLTGYVFGPKDDYYDNIFTSLGRFKEDCLNLFKKYKLPLAFIAETFVVWGINNLRLVHYLNSYNSTNPFRTPTKWIMNDKEKTVGWGKPQGTYSISISRPVTKKSLKEYIDQQWKRISKEMADFYEEVPLNKDFKTDWLIYSYYNLGKSNKEICGKIKFIHKINDIKASRIKQTINRLKLRIKQIEAVTQK
jgi:hypothetical protein